MFRIAQIYRKKILWKLPSEMSPLRKCSWRKCDSVTTPHTVSLPAKSFAFDSFIICTSVMCNYVFDTLAAIMKGNEKMAHRKSRVDALAIMVATVMSINKRKQKVKSEQKTAQCTHPNACKWIKKNAWNRPSLGCVYLGNDFEIRRKKLFFFSFAHLIVLSHNIQLNITFKMLIVVIKARQWLVIATPLKRAPFQQSQWCSFQSFYFGNVIRWVTWVSIVYNLLSCLFICRYENKKKKKNTVYINYMQIWQ